MALIDAMIEADLTRNICIVTITEKSLFLEAKGVPAFVGIEYMAQAVAAHGGYLALRNNQPIRVGFLLGTPKLISHVTHFPLSMRLQIKVAQDWGEQELMRFHCAIYDRQNGQMLQETGLNVFHPKNLDAYLAQNHQSEEGKHP